MNLQSVRAITFDVGGTLIQPWPSVGDVYAKVAKRFGIAAVSPTALTESFFRAWRNKTSFNYSLAAWQQVVEQTFGDALPCHLANDVFAAIYQEFTLPQSWRIYEDVRPTLSRLRQAGYQTGIISNWDERLRPLLTALDLAPWFEAIVISCEAGATKPERKIFDQAATTLGMPPEEILHVGDLPTEDLEGARQAGFVAAHLHRGDQIHKWPTLDSLLDLIPLLENSK